MVCTTDLVQLVQLKELANKGVLLSKHLPTDSHKPLFPKQASQAATDVQASRGMQADCKACGGLLLPVTVTCCSHVGLLRGCAQAFPGWCLLRNRPITGVP